MSRDLFARISDVAFRGLPPGFAPTPRPPDTRTRPLAHPYFPDVLQPGVRRAYYERREILLRSEPSLPKRYDTCDSPVFRAQFIDRVSDRAAEVVLDALKKGHIPARARILEVGCGNGRFLRALGTRDGAHGLRVSGVDILEADLGLARAHGGAPRLPWFPPAAPARGGYERVVNADITDARALAAALDVAGAGRYDALVSCSTMFWMGFPGDADDEPLGADEKELGAACLRGLAAAVLKPRAVALVMTAGWYDWGHAFDEAIRGELLRDWLVLRRGCMVFHARSSGELVDLPFYCHLKSFRPIPPETERVILDEVELAMDYNDVAPELRDATRLVSVAPTFEKYLDRCGAGPFWLIRHDPPAAQQAVAESDLF